MLCVFFRIFFPLFFLFRVCDAVVLVSLSMRHFQWLPLFACVARKCGKAARESAGAWVWAVPGTLYTRPLIPPSFLPSCLLGVLFFSPLRS